MHSALLDTSGMIYCECLEDESYCNAIIREVTVRGHEKDRSNYLYHEMTHMSRQGLCRDVPCHLSSVICHLSSVICPVRVSAVWEYEIVD